MRGLRAAFSFLTPLGGASPPFPGALGLFPVVGMVVGSLTGLAWSAADWVWGTLLGAILAVFADAVLTGGLHLDGVADSGDGLLAPMEVEQRLAVMSEPTVGAFGVLSLVGILALRVGALHLIVPSPLLLAAVWGTSRTLMAATIMRKPYARTQGGLASAFGVAQSTGVARMKSLWLGFAAASVLAVIWSPARGLIALVVTWGIGSSVIALGMRRLGGYTGDILGAAGVVGETAGLLFASVQWR